jgi:hypothetical protein
VACPTVSACFAVASYTNNGPSLTLVEQWNGTGTSTQAAAGRPVAPRALSPACLRGRMPGSLPSSGPIGAAAWSRFRVERRTKLYWPEKPSDAAAVGVK